jgi:hypothetical protein
MSKRILSIVGLALLMVLLTGALTASAAAPDVHFKLVQGLPKTMTLGETATVIVEVTSDTPFLYAQALPSEYYPGRGVTAAVGDHVNGGQTAQLEVTFTAKDPTDDFANAPGYAPVSVVAGVRFAGSYVVSQRYDFIVTVP